MAQVFPRNKCGGLCFCQTPVMEDPKKAKVGLVASIALVGIVLTVVALAAGASKGVKITPATAVAVTSVLLAATITSLVITTIGCRAKREPFNIVNGFPQEVSVQEGWSNPFEPRDNGREAAELEKK